MLKFFCISYNEVAIIVHGNDIRPIFKKGGIEMDNETLMINDLICLIKTELSNAFYFEDNSIAIILADKSKVKISLKKIG